MAGKIGETEAPHKSWRDRIAVHAAAELFPLMSPEELRELGEDIKKHGLKDPIMVIGSSYPESLNDGTAVLLDGRNRLDAMELAGISVVDKNGKFLYWNFNFGMVKVDYHDDPYAYVLSANIHRRHLTSEQKRDLIAKLLQAKPELSDRQIAAQTSVDHKTVGRFGLGRRDVGKFPTSRPGPIRKAGSSPRRSRSPPSSRLPPR